MKLNRIKHRKPPKKNWTYKLGRKLGKSADKLAQNRKARIIIIALLIAILFIFIVPIKNNIITLSLLALLIIAKIIINKKSK